MAFLRNYAEQGDPGPSTMRAGRLVKTRRKLKAARGQNFFAPRPRRKQMMAMRRRMLADMYRGDPFKFGKFFKGIGRGVKKLTFKKALGGLANIAQFLPIPGAQYLDLARGALGGGGGPDSPAPELVEMPRQSGTVGEASRNQYQSEDYYEPEDYYQDEPEEFDSDNELDYSEDDLEEYY